MALFELVDKPERGVPDTTTETRRWLKFSAACRYASMSDKKLKRHIDAGDIYATKRDGEWKVDRLSIDAFFLRDRAEVENIIAGLQGVTL